jgi:hypothetical protein
MSYACHNIPTANELRETHNVHNRIVNSLIKLLKDQLEMTSDPRYHCIPISSEMYNEVYHCLSAKGYKFFYKPDLSDKMSYHIGV